MFLLPGLGREFLKGTWSRIFFFLGSISSTPCLLRQLLFPHCRPFFPPFHFTEIIKVSPSPSQSYSNFSFLLLHRIFQVPIPSSHHYFHLLSFTLFSSSSSPLPIPSPKNSFSLLQSSFHWVKMRTLDRFCQIEMGREGIMKQWKTHKLYLPFKGR